LQTRCKHRHEKSIELDLGHEDVEVKMSDAEWHTLGMLLLYVCIYAAWIRHIMRDREGEGTDR
jgi:hypothetical protein